MCPDVTLAKDGKSQLLALTFAPPPPPPPPYTQFHPIETIDQVPLTKWICHRFGVREKTHRTSVKMFDMRFSSNTNEMVVLLCSWYNCIVDRVAWWWKLPSSFCWCLWSTQSPMPCSFWELSTPWMLAEASSHGPTSWPSSARKTVLTQNFSSMPWHWLTR